jgi:amino acid transporter
MTAAPMAEDASVEAFGYRQELRRSLSLSDLLVYGLLFIVPTTPLTSLGFVYNQSQGMVPLVYTVGLVAMLFTAHSYMTMSGAFPVAGSVYAYAGRGIAPAAGFLSGWVMLLDYLLLPTLAYVACAIAMAALFPDIPKAAWIVGLLGINTVISLRGIQTTAQIGKLLLLAQLIYLGTFVVLAILALSNGVAGAHLSLAPLWNPATVSPALVFGALSLASVSFLGFDAISTLSEEAKGGSQAVGTATILSLLIVAALFIGQTYLACLFLLNHGPFADGDAAATANLYVAELIGGDIFRFLSAGLLVLIAGLPAALVTQTAAARLIFSMARDGKLPSALALIDGRHQTPQRAALLVTAITLVLSLAMLDQLGLIFSLVSFGALSGFLMVHLAVLVHHGVRERSRRWVAHLISPATGFAIIAYVLINLDPLAQIVGSVWLTVGGGLLVVSKSRGVEIATE